MPSKRVSLKGKGSDLFFGGEQSGVAKPNETEHDTSPATLPSQETPDDSGIEAPEQEPAVGVQPAARPQQSRSRRTRTNGTVEGSRDMSPLSDALQNDQFESNHASMLVSYDHATIDSIRKTVKVVGREVSFVRLSAEEKRRLAGIVYTYKMQGTKTSENEINRIAINLLLEDYESNGEQSVLARVLGALHA